MVAALIRWRHGPASRSAALSRIAQRSSKGIARHAGAASVAALDRGLGVGLRGVLHGAEHVLVVVRLDDLDLRAAARFLRPPMWAREVVLLALQPCSSSATSASRSGAAGRVGQVRLVDRSRREGDGVHATAIVRPTESPVRAETVRRASSADLLGGAPREVVVRVGVVLGVRRARRPRFRIGTGARPGRGSSSTTTTTRRRSPSRRSATRSRGGVGGGHQRGVLRLLGVVLGPALAASSASTRPHRQAAARSASGRLVAPVRDVDRGRS